MKWLFSQTHDLARSLVPENLGRRACHAEPVIRFRSRDGASMYHDILSCLCLAFELASAYDVDPDLKLQPHCCPSWQVISAVEIRNADGAKP